METLLKEGERLGIPKDKKRALVREYFQTKILYYLYSQKNASKLSLIGGSGLRLLRDLDRFSEDLDFDNLGLSFRQSKKLFEKCQKELIREGLKIEFKFKKTNNSGTGHLKFIELLYQLGVTSHRAEKLMIKLDYTVPKIKPVTEILILNRFGVVQSIITNSLEFILSQKIRAILSRKAFLPRDFYDLVWLISRGVKPHPKLFGEMKVKNQKELYLKVWQVFNKKIRPNLKSFKLKLAPFLMDSKKTYYLEIFGDLMKTETEKLK